MRDRHLEAVELALRRGGTSRLDRPVDDDALARRRARPLARYASNGADAVHVGIEGTEDIALARRFAHAAELVRLQRPRDEPGHLLVEPSDIERRPVFAVADAVEADFDLALHHVRNHRHDLRRHLLAADLTTGKAEGCLLEARSYGQPPHVVGTDSLCAILHRPPPRRLKLVPGRSATATMIDPRSPSRMRGPDDDRQYGRHPQIQSPLAIGPHRRSNQTLRFSLRRAQSGSKFSRTARFAGQLRRKRSTDAA